MKFYQPYDKESGWHSDRLFSTKKLCQKLRERNEKIKTVTLIEGIRNRIENLIFMDLYDYCDIRIIRSKNDY